MANPPHNHDDLWDKLEWLALIQEEEEGARSDIATLLLYRSGFDTINPMYLFWELYRPQMLALNNSATSQYSPTHKLSPEAESIVLDLLEDLHHRHRVPYKPDDGDSDIKKFFEDCADAPSIPSAPDNLTNLLILIHVAAARAFTLKRASGISEEVLDCLDEVERAWQRLQLAGLSNWHVTEITSFYEVFNSIEVVSALALLERSYETRRQGYYSQALHQMSESAYRYASGINCDGGPSDTWPLDNDELPEHEPYHDFHSFLTGMHAPLEYCLDTFRLLKDSRAADNDWSQLAYDCKQLAHEGMFLCFPATPEEAMNEDVYDISVEQSEKRILPELDMNRKESGPGVEGFDQTWREFWLSAATWASAQLSPSEYRKLREEDERYSAESRLKNYFFGNNWDILPQQAQQRIITADVNWHSKQRMSQEAILNDLLRATEAICRRFIWQPLTNSKNSSREFLYFLRRDSQIAENPRRSRPEVRDFIWACEQPFFLEFIEQQNLSDDVAFLSENLPTAMRQLANERGTAEHNTGESTASEVIESTYQLFLGIGRPGILPELARIGRKLRTGRSRRRSPNRPTSTLTNLKTDKLI